MKLLPCFILIAAAFILAGCTSNTPDMSGKERFAEIHRYNVYQSEQFNDDVDNVLMLRPSNQESVWNVYHR